MPGGYCKLELGITRAFQAIRLLPVVPYEYTTTSKDAGTCVCVIGQRGQIAGFETDGLLISVTLTKDN